MRRITRGKVLIGNADLTLVSTGSTALIPGTLADGAGTTTTFLATGLLFGDYVLVSHSTATLGGVTLTGYIHGAGTAGVRWQNESGGTATLGTVTTNYLVLRA